MNIRQLSGPRLRCVFVLGTIVCSACREPPWTDALDQQQALENGSLSAEIWAEAIAAVPYDSIRFARGECDPECDNYVLVLARSGAARYVVTSRARAVRPVGRWQGEVDIYDYVRLVDLVVRQSLLSRMSASSEASIQHGWGFRLDLWERGTEDAHSYQGWEVEGPTEAWALRAALDGVASRIDWQPSG